VSTSLRGRNYTRCSGGSFRGSSATKIPALRDGSHVVLVGGYCNPTEYGIKMERRSDLQDHGTIIFLGAASFSRTRGIRDDFLIGRTVFCYTAGTRYEGRRH
jgi:hypothetical protein